MSEVEAKKISNRTLTHSAVLPMKMKETDKKLSLLRTKYFEVRTEGCIDKNWYTVIKQYIRL